MGSIPVGGAKTAYESLGLIGCFGISTQEPTPWHRHGIWVRILSADGGSLLTDGQPENIAPQGQIPAQITY